MLLLRRLGLTSVPLRLFPLPPLLILRLALHGGGWKARFLSLPLLILSFDAWLHMAASEGQHRNLLSESS